MVLNFLNSLNKFNAIDSTSFLLTLPLPLSTHNKCRNSPTTLDQYDVSVFGPNGMEMTPAPDIFSSNVFYDPLSQSRGNIMPRTSQALMIIVPYSGTGDYTVYFSGLLHRRA